MAEDLRLPKPNADEVNEWAGRLTREEIHNVLWRQANRRRHEITEGLREPVSRIYPDPHDQEMVLDGVALGIEASGKFEDDEVIRKMVGKITEPTVMESPEPGEAA